FLGINQCAYAVVVTYLGEQTFINASVDDVDALHSGMTGGGVVNRLGKHLRQDFLFMARQNRVEVRHQHLADELALLQKAVLRGDVDQFDGAEALRHFQRDTVGVDAIGFAVAVETERRHDRNDALIPQRLQQLDIHALDLPREMMINALYDTHRVRDDGVGTGGAQVVGRKTREDL